MATIFTLMRNLARGKSSQSLDNTDVIKMDYCGHENPARLIARDLLPVCSLLTKAMIKQACAVWLPPQRACFLADSIFSEEHFHGQLDNPFGVCLAGDLPEV
jgi:hypothetical protein